ncbi:MAG: ferrous iron transport protein B, partial [Bacteroidetes bacterium]|nr:ferrous iron transport protein B [Bacteroidota bacterium]
RLSDLKTSESGIVIRVSGHGSFRQRMIEMGFVRGKEVKVIKNAPLLDPVEYALMGYRLALRRSEAERVEVMAVAEGEEEGWREEEGLGQGSDRLSEPAGSLLAHPIANRYLHGEQNHIRVALAGNPNCGKTSLFNQATRAHERVGNYSGVTVDAKAGHFEYKDYTIHLIDLPGTYSLTAYTPEEVYVRKHLLEEKPDLVLNVLDVTNLERNMYLTTQLIDMDIKVVAALNMYDEFLATGAELDYDSLGRMMGIPMLPTVASKGEGLAPLWDTVIAVFEDNDPVLRHIHIHYGADTEQSIDRLQDKIWENASITDKYSSRYLSIKLLESDEEAIKIVEEEAANSGAILEVSAKERAKGERLFGQNMQTTLANARYGFISGALGETLRGKKIDVHIKSGKIDQILTGKYTGIPIFLLFLFLMFQTTFSLGKIPADWLAQGIASLGRWIEGMLSAWPVLRGLVVDGMIGGMGGVLVFLPNILILFLFISIMEDSGYMARAAFMMDKLMHKIGLHGKSFIPLIMGFGCNVPAIMATRLLESRKDRILTILIIPFMSCSARLPLYVLLISAFFVRYQGLVLFSIYLIGILVGIISSILLHKWFFSKHEAPFVMELPPYRRPGLRSVMRHMWHKGGQYIKKMGTVILLASVVIWGLGYFPQGRKSLEDSYIGKIGHVIAPVLRPLGFDWQIGVSLAGGFAAKEIIVSTMSVLSTEHDSQAQVSSPLAAYTLMIFVLLYFPCIASVVAVKREAGPGWAAFIVGYTVALAWLLSFAVFQVGSLF